MVHTERQLLRGTACTRTHRSPEVVVEVVWDARVRARRSLPLRSMRLLDRRTQVDRVLIIVAEAVAVDTIVDTTLTHATNKLRQLVVWWGKWRQLRCEVLLGQGKAPHPQATWRETSGAKGDQRMDYMGN